MAPEYRRGERWLYESRYTRRLAITICVLNDLATVLDIASLTVAWLWNPAILPYLNELVGNEAFLETPSARMPMLILALFLFALIPNAGTVVFKAFRYSEEKSQSKIKDAECCIAPLFWLVPKGTYVYTRVSSTVIAPSILHSPLPAGRNTLSPLRSGMTCPQEVSIPSPSNTMRDTKDDSSAVNTA